jgi:hypothetical protein
MRKLYTAFGVICLFLLFGVAAAQAREEPKTYVYKDDFTVLRLFTGEPCALPALLRMAADLDEDPKEYRRGELTYKGQLSPVCFKIFTGQGVCIVSEEYGHGDMPLDAFKEELGV